MPHLIATPAHQIENNAPFPSLPREALLRMADAGAKVVDCIRDLNTSGSNLVIEALRGSGDFTEWEHYPPNDVYDLKSHAQYYFHAHPPDDRDASDYGHFHTFLRPKGMPLGIRPAKVKGHALAVSVNEALSHLIAISMTPSGMPEALFTTNRWVTGETWYGAADVTAMLDHFVIDLDQPSPLLNQWLTAMFILFRPQIEELVIERDRTIIQWQTEHPDLDVFEDRRLEITSSKAISLYRQIEWLDDQLEPGSSDRSGRISCP
ncbi:MAG: hypothetical protein AB7O60_01220 [Variibacter sp.]